MNAQILEGYDNYVLFGTHIMGVQALKQFREAGIEVACFCDNDQNKWGTYIDGVRIIPPDALAEFVKHNCALVIICSSYSKHLIAQQLEEMAVPYVYFSKPVYVELNNICNQSCIFCPYAYQEREKTSLDFNLVKDFLFDLKSNESDVLYPTLYPHVLGEPLLSKHFFDFMDMCKELEFYVCLVTNWTLMDEKVQKRIFGDYPNVDIILSLQGPTEKSFLWRGEKKLSYTEWIDRMFEIMESKFKYAHHGLIQISTIFPDVVNKLLTRSDSDLHIFEWYDSIEEFKLWKRTFGARCVAFNNEMKYKYPENYDIIKNSTSPVSYYFNLYHIIKDFDEWVETDCRAQFEFAPNIHIYEKKFGIWGAEDYFKALLPEDKYLYWEENWHARTEACDRVGDISLLSNGQLVACCLDNEADYVVADLNKGEKYSDSKTKEYIHKLRNNLSVSPLCRKCKSRALIFNTTNMDKATQLITHYGMRWHKKKENALGEIYRASYEHSQVFVYPRISANKLEIDIGSLQNKKQVTLVKILRYDDETKLFTECKNFSLVLKPGERLKHSIPFVFEKKLHRIDFITATQCIDGVDNGIALYEAYLSNNTKI